MSGSGLLEPAEKARRHTGISDELGALRQPPSRESGGFSPGSFLRATMTP